MNIALVGTGRMGAAVKAIAPTQGHTVVAQFNRTQPLTSPDQLKGADVAIDFSLQEVVVQHLQICCEARISTIVGTTGWQDQLPVVADMVSRSRAAVLHSPNFSLGVQVTLHAVHAMGKLLDQLPEYDVALREIHHTGKKDHPSGTAIQLAQAVVKGLQRKTTWGLSGEQVPHKLEIATTRVGTVFGQHAVIADSPYDQVTIVHEAKNREGFALGALKAAEWIQGRQGMFVLQDMLSDWLGNTT